MVSHGEWANEVERVYGLVTWFQGEPMSMRAMRRVLLCRPIGAVCRVVVAVVEAVEGLGS